MMERHPDRGIPILILALLAGAGCVRQPPQAAPPPPPQVTVARPVPRAVLNYSEFTGRTEAVETVEVRVRVRGYLVSVKFKDGQDVKKGELLYEIDPRTFEADLEGAKAEVNRLESQVQVTKAEAERAVRLRATGGLAQEDYLQKIGARDQAVATLRKAQADVRSRELELSFCKIHAPIDGQISRTLVTEGNLVGYSEPTLLTTIVKYDPIYVYFDGTERGSLEYDRLVREQGVASAEQGRVPVHVGLATDKDYPNKGVVDFRDNRVDPNTGTVRLRAVLKNADKVIRPGLFSRLRIPIGKPQERLLVPEAALSSDPRGRYLLAVDGENVVQYRPVKVLPNTYGGFYAVEDGLKPDEWVVVNGLQRARPGLKVEPKRETLTPPKLADDGAVGN